MKFDAEAKDRLLAGAEMGLQSAHVPIDFINPTNSKQDGEDRGNDQNGGDEKRSRGFPPPLLQGRQVVRPPTLQLLQLLPKSPTL